MRDDCFTAIPRIDDEPVRNFFERYARHAPYGRISPWRYEIEQYTTYPSLMLPVVDPYLVDAAVDWCVEHVDAPNWFNRGLTFYFTNASDAVFFKLTFSTVDPE